MSSKLDESDFVDRDLEATKETGVLSPGSDESSAPPSRAYMPARRSGDLQAQRSRDHVKTAEKEHEDLFRTRCFHAQVA